VNKVEMLCCFCKIWRSKAEESGRQVLPYPKVPRKLEVGLEILTFIVAAYDEVEMAQNRTFRQMQSSIEQRRKARLEYMTQNLQRHMLITLASRTNSMPLTRAIGGRVTNKVYTATKDPMSSECTGSMSKAAFGIIEQVAHFCGSI
jgi:hypothetical protein